MRKLVRYGWGFALAAGLLMGCASGRESQAVRIEPVRTLMADTASMIRLDVDFCISRRALAKRHRLIVVPQLWRHHTMVAEFPPVVVDAPLYSRKLRRKQVLYGYVDTLAEHAWQATGRQDLRIPYRHRVSVPHDGIGGRIVGIVSTDGCGECGEVDTLDMAYLSTTPELLPPLPPLRYRWIEPTFVVRPKLMLGRGEALMQFKINRHDIDLRLGRNESELQSMLASLSKIVSDSLATLTHVKIEGMASADGSYAFNTGLAARRAAAAKQWLVSQLHLPKSVAARFEIGSRPEGWGPVLQAMQAEGHPDTVQVAELIRRFAHENDDVAERHIRRLACWKDIKQQYLQKDRKVLYEYAYTLKSFTSDEELLLMYRLRPDAFNEEEFLRVSTLRDTPSEKQEVYRTMLPYFPASQTAANNLALLLLQEGQASEAVKVLKGLSYLEWEGQLTLASAYVQLGDYAKAEDVLRPYVHEADARYNLGIVKAQQRQWNEAYRLLKDFSDRFAAVVSLCVGQTQQAQRQMDVCSDVSPAAAYVRAVIAARLHQPEELLRQLKQAVTEDGWRERAAVDVEFREYWQDEAFREVWKGGEQ